MNLLSTIEAQWQYWHIQNWCIQYPQLALAWAAACEAEAVAKAVTHPESAEFFRVWAQKLRESLAT